MDHKDENKNDDRLKAFDEWMPKDKLYGEDMFLYRNNVFYGISMDYGLAVTSKTLEQAREDLKKLTVGYILAFFDNGQPHETCLRKQPLAFRIRAKILNQSKKYRCVPPSLGNSHYDGIPKYKNEE